MAKHPDVRSGKWDLSSLKQVLAGAAPLGKEACKEFEAVWAKHFNHPDEVPCIRQGWGMTEGTLKYLVFCEYRMVNFTCSPLLVYSPLDRSKSNA